MIENDHVRHICADMTLRVIRNTAAIETTGREATRRMSPGDLMAYVSGRASAEQSRKPAGKASRKAIRVEVARWIEQAKRGGRPEA